MININIPTQTAKGRQPYPICAYIHQLSVFSPGCRLYAFGIADTRLEFTDMPYISSKFAYITKLGITGIVVTSLCWRHEMKGSILAMCAFAVLFSLFFRPNLSLFYSIVALKVAQSNPSLRSTLTYLPPLLGFQNVD